MFLKLFVFIINLRVGGAVCAPANITLSTDGRRWLMPLRMVVLSACGCWSMPAPTRRPRPMCVVGRCFSEVTWRLISLFLLYLSSLWNFLYSSFSTFSVSKIPRPALRNFIFPVSFLCWRLFVQTILHPLFLNYFISFSIALVLTLSGVNLILSKDGRRWFGPLGKVTWTACGCWSMPAPTRMPRPTGWVSLSSLTFSCNFPSPFEDVFSLLLFVWFFHPLQDHFV